MPKYRYIRLSDEEKLHLEAIEKQGKTQRERSRAQAILLSHRGYAMDQLADICDCNRDTINRWFGFWEQRKKVSDQARSGRPPKLSEDVKKN